MRVGYWRRCGKMFGCAMDMAAGLLRLCLAMTGRGVMHVLLVGVVALNVSACGNKGKLKTPTQMRVQEEKKARKGLVKENTLVKPEGAEMEPVGREAPVPSPENTKREADDENISGKDMPVIITPSNDLAK